MSKRLTIVTITIGLILALGMVAFRTFNPAAGFTYYEPSYLPPGVSIKAKRIHINKHAPTRIEQNFRTEDWVYAIREYQASEDIGDAKQNYDEESINPTCDIKNSPGMTRYRLCHWTDYGKINVHEVKLVKGETFINAQIPTKISEAISVEEIDKFVDSFSEKSTVGLPVLRSSGA